MLLYWDISAEMVLLADYVEPSCVANYCYGQEVEKEPLASGKAA
jgi:hypothetical protein